MGTQRNGARTALNLIARACKLSKSNGWRAGIIAIFGSAQANEFFAVWDPFCTFVDIAVGLDNWYNQIDQSEERTGSEDAPFPAL